MANEYVRIRRLLEKKYFGPALNAITLIGDNSMLDEGLQLEDIANFSNATDKIISDIEKLRDDYLKKIKQETFE